MAEGSGEVPVELMATWPNVAEQMVSEVSNTASLILSIMMIVKV